MYYLSLVLLWVVSVCLWCSIFMSSLPGSCSSFSFFGFRRPGCASFPSPSVPVCAVFVCLFLGLNLTDPPPSSRFWKSFLFHCVRHVFAICRFRPSWRWPPPSSCPGEISRRSADYGFPCLPYLFLCLLCPGCRPVPSLLVFVVVGPACVCPCCARCRCFSFLSSGSKGAAPCR